MLSSLAVLISSVPVSVKTSGDRTWVDNGQISLSVDRKLGTYEVRFGTEGAIRGAVGVAKFSDGLTRRSSEADSRSVSSEKIKDSFGRGVRLSVRNRFKDGPELRQLFWVYEGKSEVMVRLEAVSSKALSSNYLAPVVTSLVEFDRGSKVQALHVPYDNDDYVRYNSDGWDAPSYEVGAIYDDSTRRGIVVGSLDHDLWKSGITFAKSGGLDAVAGVTGKLTRDHEPHGMVTGKTFRSPRFVLGYYDDWREGLERFGDLNALVKPPLPWSEPVPFGWSSWSGHKTKISAADADAATEFVDKELPWFRSGDTAYINLDSFWDNMTRDQRVAFVKKAHAAGLKAGIYWTPFVCWGELDWKVDKQPYIYHDLAIKDSKGTPLPKLDGGWPLDPTHPGTLTRIDRELKEFMDQGFDLIKLDFLTHGALEGRHYHPKITTGTAAYAVGMQRVVDGLSKRKVGRPVFIALSIAPMFPTGYGHSRRISCDIFANIGASEYFLNSQNYGWWSANRLYKFNDPDSASVYQPKDEPAITEAESRTRFTASVIGGGIMIEGDNLTDPAAKERVRQIFSNREALALAKMCPQFRPADGATGSKAGDLFVWKAPDGKTAYVAAFNFDKTTAKTMRVPLARLGLSGTWSGRDVWTRADSSIEGEMLFKLPAMDCSLVRLTLR